jgi:hypothetical protein
VLSFSVCPYNVHVSVMSPYLYPVFNIWFQLSQLLLLFIIACICSLYLVHNALPVLCILVGSLIYSSLQEEQ